MQLHQLKPRHASRSKTRIGRGGKRGTMSGRGQKGQKSRSGHKIRPAVRDLMQRLPKLRGYKNKPLQAGPAVVNLSDIQKMKESVITKDVLKAHALVNKKYQGAVKVLGDGDITRSVELRGLKVSKTALAKIEKAGGKAS